MIYLTYNQIYCKVLAAILKVYIKQKRLKGDTRSNNEIVKEWIYYYSDRFRRFWKNLENNFE